MTTQEIRIAVAELCGWRQTGAQCEPGQNEVKHFSRNYGIAREQRLLEYELPNYPESLDACREFEGTLRDDNSLTGKVAYCNILMRVCGTYQGCVTSTALQRCEAYLKMNNKWKD